VAREILMLRGHAFGVTGIDVDPDHQTVVTSGTDGQVILWPADPVASRAEGLDN
jgi:WD40 repeat protein